MAEAEIEIVTPAGVSRPPAATCTIYGLRLCSDLPLPLPVAQHADGASRPDVRVRLCEAGAAPSPNGTEVYAIACPIHGADLRVHRDEGGAWIWHQAVGTFHVSPDTAQVDIYPEPAADARALAHGLLGSVLIYILLKRGRPVLHASAVITSRGAIAFLGPCGQGKSTLAATFLHQGAALLTDDALPIGVDGERVHGERGPAYMKLWRETAAQALAHADELPDMMANYDKKLLALDGRFAVADAPTPLRAVYVLSRFEPGAAEPAGVTFHALTRRDGLTALLAYTSNRAYLLPAEEAPLLPIYARLATQTPVRILRYPSGFGHQEAVHQRILADLEDG